MLISLMHFYRIFVVFNIQLQNLDQHRLNVPLVKTMYNMYFTILYTRFAYFTNRSVTWQVQNTQHAIKINVFNGKLHCMHTNRLHLFYLSLIYLVIFQTCDKCPITKFHHIFSCVCQIEVNLSLVFKVWIHFFIIIIICWHFYLFSFITFVHFTLSKINVVFLL